MLLSCPLCCKPHFEGVDSLRMALISVANDLLTCPVCQETLKGLDKLTIHLFGHVTNNCVSDSATKSENGNIVISVPKILSSSYDENESIKQDIDESISKIFNKEDQKTIHEEYQVNTLKVQEAQSRVNEEITCDICSFTFTDRNLLEMHQKLLHQTTADQNTGIYSYHCHLCSKKFRMRGSLMVHLRVAHLGFANHLDRPLNNGETMSKLSQDTTTMEVDSTANSPPKSQEYKQWSCDICAKTFTTKYFLKKHNRLHTGEMPYSCTICSKSFTFQQSYHKHMLYHSSEKPYICSECGRAFKEHSTLQNHVRIHSGERPYGCEICGKRFRQRVSYLVHTRIHTGIMPYKCTACDKSFRYKVSQRSHKCSMDPPGSVILVNESETTLPHLGSNKLTSAVLPNNKLDMPIELPLESFGAQNIDIKSTKCTMADDYDIGSIASENVMKNYQQTLITHPNKIYPNQLDDNCLNKEFYKPRESIVVSPNLPEVQTLCLNNNSPNHPASPGEENILLIREKCLEELFK